MSQAGALTSGSGSSGVTSVTGTLNRITAIPTTGAVVVNISPNYVGQNTITTLGTITTGTWDAGVIAGQYGGTGVDNAGLTINLGSGHSGYVLTSDSSGNATWEAASGGSGIITIDGDSGSVTGSTVKILANEGSNYCGSSVSTTCSGTTLVLNVTDANGNTIMGSSAGTITITGNSNTGVGTECLFNLTSGVSNIALGECNGVISGSYNIAVGDTSLNGVDEGLGNVGVGYGAGAQVQNNYNTMVGYNAAYALVIGSNNVTIGYNAGNSLNANSTYSNNILIGTNAGVGSSNAVESNNIMIGNAGIDDDANVIRIGTQGSSTGEQNTCYIAGIEGATYSATSPTPALVYCDTSTGQLVSYSGANNPAASFSLTVGTAAQNTLGYDILLSINVTVSSSTTATLSVGVGSTNTPSAIAFTPSFTVATTTVYHTSVIVPNKYYVKLTDSGTITVASVTTVATQL